MWLIGTKYNGLMLLVRFIQIKLYPLFLPLLYFYDAVEIFLFIYLAFFDFTHQNCIIRCVHIVINCGFYAAHLKRCEESIIDALLERIGIDRLAEIQIGIYIVFPFWCGC